jgi:hypothetical protein
MKLPRNNSELTQIFKDAQIPKVSGFVGEYFVDMLTVLPSLITFSHRKTFFTENNKTAGYNILFTKTIWGHFFVEEGICKELDSLNVAVINYDRIKNSFIANKIRDHVRCLKENALYLRRFNYLFMGELHFLGYFSLSRTRGESWGTFLPGERVGSDHEDEEKNKKIKR